MAARLKANVWPELYDDLLALVKRAAAELRDPKQRVYWAAVYAELTK